MIISILYQIIFENVRKQIEIFCNLQVLQQKACTEYAIFVVKAALRQRIMISFKQVNIIYCTQISQAGYLSYCTLFRILQNSNKTKNIVGTNANNSKSAS